MSILLPTMVDRTCSFKTKNPNDTTLWVGTIEGVALSQRLAARDENLAAYNAAVRQVDSTVPSDLSQLHFFAISLPANTGGAAEVRTFAEEWLTDGSFKLTDQLSTAVITVPFDQTSQSVADILAQLFNAGYVSAQATSVTVNS